LAGIFITPTFAANHFSPDGVLLSSTVNMIQLVRLLAICMGISAVAIGILFFIWPKFADSFLTSVSKYIFYWIITGYVLYCVIFILNTSFIIDGVRYFTLFDDAMISMQYAKNLTQGYGLVWNPGGAPVEGYSNFLWVLYMAFWHLFPINEAKIALPIQLSGLIFLVGSLFLVRKIARNISDENKYVSISAVLLTASYLPITFWALRGKETSVIGFIVLLVIWRFFRCIEEKSFDPLLFIILGIGMLIRVDFAFLFVGLSLFMVAAVSENRKRNLLTASSVFLLIISAESAFRWFYYNDILPNTFYLKVAGVPFLFRILRGLSVTKDFIINMSPFLFVLPFLYGVLRIKNKKLSLLMYAFLLQLFYNIYVGGDAWEWWGNLANRYLCIVMPAFFILLSLMMSRLIEAVNISSINHSIFQLADLKRCCFVILILLIIFQLHGGISYQTLNLLAASGIHIHNDKDMIKFALQLKDITTPSARIAVVWAGTIPYFSDRYCIDIAGYNDAFIAHQEARIKSYKDFLPGHNKYDYSYSIGKLKPDIVAELWKKEAAYPFLDKDYKTANINGHTIFLRRNSPNIKWTEIKNIDSE